MTAETIRQPEGRIRQVGKVLIELTIVNAADEVRAADGTIDNDDVRSITLGDVLVDTGATTLCLPMNLVRQLGLKHLTDVVAPTANGTASFPLFEHAKISLYGRTGTFECMGLAEGAEPLLGVFPLEMLGLEPDLQNQRLRVLPDHGARTYLLVPHRSSVNRPTSPQLSAHRAASRASSG